jgi:hypothetical protein
LDIIIFLNGIQQGSPCCDEFYCKSPKTKNCTRQHKPRKTERKRRKTIMKKHLSVHSQTIEKELFFYALKSVGLKHSII